jgi:hypothetical protein
MEGIIKLKFRYIEKETKKFKELIKIGEKNKIRLNKDIINWFIKLKYF